MENEIIADAEIVFSKTDFQDDTDFNIYPISIYQCPICNNKLSFSKQNFEKYQMNTISTFPIDEQTKIMELIKVENINECNSFLEFYCSMCKSPTRVYFNTWAGGRFTGGYRLKFIIIVKEG